MIDWTKPIEAIDGPSAKVSGHQTNCKRNEVAVIIRGARHYYNRITGKPVYTGFTPTPYTNQLDLQNVPQPTTGTWGVMCDECRGPEAMMLTYDEAVAYAMKQAKEYPLNNFAVVLIKEWFSTETVTEVRRTLI